MALTLLTIALHVDILTTVELCTAAARDPDAGVARVAPKRLVQDTLG